MPQMAPLNWLALYISTALLYILFNSLSYFESKYYPINSQTSNSKIMYNWKW
uniref:ATP synthase complex subunit 8 n=1 Tax=Obrium sp. NS-2015 TaxID=1776756 RepID=A0A0U4K5B3_9CUCU|nr:ATP synthase F0 subunit 8 [Obrium sp. NS-2015]